MSKSQWITAGVAVVLTVVLLVVLRALADSGRDPIGDLAATFRPRADGGA